MPSSSKNILKAIRQLINENTLENAQSLAGLIDVRLDDGLSDKYTDENYRYKDVGYIAGSRKEQAQASIFSAKKEGLQVYATDIDWDALEEDSRIAADTITKKNVFGQVDWDRLKAGGMHGNVGYLIKRIYAAVALKPDIDDAETRKLYVVAIQNLRQIFEKCKTYEDALNELVALSKLLNTYRNMVKGEDGKSTLNYDSLVAHALGKKFKSWVFKSGNKALHESKKMAIDDWSWLEPSDKMTTSAPKKKPFQLEAAADINRIGGAKVDIKSTEQFKDTFGLKAIQSGNWVLKDKESIEFHVQRSAEAMSDMADVTGIPAHLLGFGGRLGLAFGARGKGGALAHYEPVQRVINITKMKGGGSLGHEYFHALDNIIHDLIHQKDNGAAGYFATENPKLLPDGLVKEAFSALRKAMKISARNSRMMTITEDIRNKAKGIVVSGLIDNLRLKNVDLSTPNKLIEALASHAGNRYTGVYRDKEISKQGVYVVLACMIHLGMITGNENEVEFPVLWEQSDFEKAAIRLDEGKQGKYWSKTLEMAARAYSAYLQDRLDEQGRVNDYLAYSTKGGNNRVGESAYPQGKEREAINAAFDKLFLAIKKEQVFEKAVANKDLMDSIFGNTSANGVIKAIRTLLANNTYENANNLPIRYQDVRGRRHNTWDGVGDKPYWLEQSMRYGASLEDFAVEKPVYDAVDDLSAQRQKADMVIQSIPKTLEKLRLLDENSQVLATIRLYEKNLNDLQNADTLEAYEMAFKERAIATESANKLIGGKPQSYFNDLKALKEAKKTELVAVDGQVKNDHNKNLLILSAIKSALAQPTFENLQELANRANLGLITKPKKVATQEQFDKYNQIAFTEGSDNAEKALREDMRLLGYDATERNNALEKLHEFYLDTKKKLKKAAEKAERDALPKISKIVKQLLDKPQQLRGKEKQFLEDIKSKRVLSIKQRDWLEAIAKRLGVAIDGDIGIKASQKDSRPKMSFEDWAEDFLDVHVALMGGKELEETYKSYKTWFDSVNDSSNSIVNAIRQALDTPSDENIQALARAAGLKIVKPLSAPVAPVITQSTDETSETLGEQANKNIAQVQNSASGLFGDADTLESQNNTANEYEIFAKYKNAIAMDIVKEIKRVEVIKAVARSKGKYSSAEHNRKKIAQKWGVNPVGWGTFDKMFGYALEVTIRGAFSGKSVKYTDQDIHDGAIKFINEWLAAVEKPVYDAVSDNDPKEIISAIRQALDTPSDENIKALAREAGLEIAQPQVNASQTKPKKKITTYGWNRYLMSKNLTNEELETLAELTRLKHKTNKNGIYLYDKQGLKKLDTLSWITTWRLNNNDEAKFGKMLDTDDIKRIREEVQRDYENNRFDDIGGFNFEPMVSVDATMQAIKKLMAENTLDNARYLAMIAGLKLKEDEPSQDLDMFGEPINQDFDLFGEPIQDGDESPVEELPRLAVVELPLNKLTLSEDVPQFKSGADGESGVVEALGGKFDRTGVAPIQVWERADGRLEIISGRHRTDLARRSGEKTIPAQVHKESEGFTAKQAMMLDAELNIRDGQGKVKDYVDYFTHSEISEDEAERRGLIARSIGQRAFIIASKGSEELITLHRNEIISDQAAAEIASIAPNNSAMQAVGLRVLQEHKPLNNALNTIRAVQALTREKGQEPDTFDLFGFDDSALKEAEAMARIASRKQRQIAEQLNAIKGAVKNPKLAAKHGVVVENEADALAKVQAMTAQKARWDNWSSHADLLAEVREELNAKFDSLLDDEDDYYWLCQEELAL